MTDLTRRGFMKMSAVGLGALLSPRCIASAADSARKPNIVVILADDLGYGDVGCNNKDSKIPTPDIDALAAEGLRFTDAHTNTAQCTPTRYGLLTGRYSWRTRLKTGVLPHFAKPLIAKERITIASLLKSKGYATAVIGKWHLGLGWRAKKGRTFAPDSWGAAIQAIDFTKKLTASPLDHGFDYYFGIGSSNNMLPYCYIENDAVVQVPEKPKRQAYDTEWRGAPVSPDYKSEQIDQVLWKKAIAWLNRHFDKTQKKPFFLYYPTSAIHRPCLAVEEFRKSSKAGLRGDKVVELDNIVGRLVAELKKHGCLDDTLILFTSDNGARPGDIQGALKKLADNDYGQPYDPAGLLDRKAEGTFGKWLTYGHKSCGPYLGYKMSIHEGGHRVPFIVRWPGVVKPGTTSDEIICMTDVLATLANILQVDLPEDAGEDSYSFLPVLKGDKLDGPIREATILDSWNGVKAVRQGDWKLIMADNSGAIEALEKRKTDAPVQLYNLRKDPRESNNLCEKYPEKVKRLTAYYARYAASSRSAPLVRYSR